MEEVLSSQVRHNIAEALAEDVGSGDWTTRYCVDARLQANARIVARQPGFVAGLAAAAEVFHQLGGAELSRKVDPGARVERDSVIAMISGSARDILTGERVALNFLCHLSGVATLTRRFVDAIEGTSARITHTRKTTPLWRELERSAVRAGGAVSHRSGLDDMILIKENHIVCSGSLTEAVQRARASNTRGLPIEVEARNLEEVREAASTGVNRIMLDNMDAEDVGRAVEAIRAVDEEIEIEASGGINLDNVHEYAERGVNYISVGAITHSAPVLDLSLLFDTVES